MIDLHCHSHFSDGELSPSALLQKALDARVTLLALTDHDTIDGLQDLHTAAQGCDITLIDGIELSVRWKKYDIHVLGLNINPAHPGLLKLISEQNTRRITRAKEIGERLTMDGIENAYEKARDISGHDRVGRPHFAKLIVNEGRAQDMKTAFKRFLIQGRSAYVATAWLDLELAVAGIIESGGMAVIAHPLKYGLTRTKLHELIKAFKDAGGAGLEVVSGEMTVLQANELAGLCCRYNLMASTGSDYHGDAVSRLALGSQRTLPVNCTPIWHQWKC